MFPKKIATFVAKNKKNMAKDKIAYVCSNCGQESTKWIGKCPSCGQWNTFKEIRVASDNVKAKAHQAAATASSQASELGHAIRNEQIGRAHV